MLKAGDAARHLLCSLSPAVNKLCKLSGQSVRTRDNDEVQLYSPRKNTKKSIRFKSDGATLKRVYNSDIPKKADFELIQDFARDGAFNYDKEKTVKKLVAGAKSWGEHNAEVWYVPGFEVGL